MASLRSLAERRPDCELSVITVTYNSAHAVTGLLGSVQAVRPDAEVIVVDNASSDDISDVVKDYDSVRLVRLDENVGFGRACNDGASAASGRWLLFANPDVMIDSLKLPNSRAYGLLSTCMDTAGRGKGLASRAETTYVEDYLTNVISRFLPPPAARLVPPTRSRPAGWVSGALFLTSREAFALAKGFDERFFMYFEDRDLGRRYRASGRSIGFAAGVAGRHAHNASSSGVSRPHREALALISWIEYLGIWGGQSQADVTAARVMRGLALGQRFPQIPPLSARIERKTEETRAIIEQIRALASSERLARLGFYPHARAAVAAQV